jgi:prepilin-type N-terminal cleavage/methylation domain-containing protein
MMHVSRQTGFTLMEMVVTIAIVSLLLMLINQLFNDSADAVGRGVQTADIIGTHRMVSQQMEEDFAAMVKPDATGAEAGFLVIINKQYSDMEMPNPDDPRAMVNPPAAGDPPALVQKLTRLRTIRSDQICFIRGTELGDAPLIPLDGDTYAPYKPTTNPGYAKLWYGHVLRTKADGLLLSDGIGSGREQFGYQLILGRQAMYLEDLSASPTPTRAAEPYWDAPVQSGFVDTSVPAAIQVAYAGLADLANFTLAQITGTGLNLDNPALTPNQYRDAAYGMTYVFERLRCNPTPDGFESWKIAQMHPYFAPNVSDFIVEFAADADTDGEMDTDPTTNDIIWYSGLDDPRVDSDVLDGTENIFSGSTTAPIYHQPLATNVDTAFIFRHDDDEALLADKSNATTTASRWPYLIRIRYRLHDTRGRITTAVYNNDTADYEPSSGQWFEMILPVSRP